VTAFGRRRRDLWMLDPRVTYLNHGTVGATPRRVLDRQQAIRDEIERQPSAFLLRSLTRFAGTAPGPTRMRAAAAAVAPFLGVAPDDLVFVDNATAGINAVLRSFPFDPGDEILTLDLSYGAIRNAITYAARERGGSVRVLAVPFPPFDAAALVEALEGALGPRTRIAVIDHVTSESALILPLVEMAAACRRHGVAVLVDGAHVPGAVPVDIAALGVDWYAANLHKWAWAPRSCGVLWASRARQAHLHPPVISWGLDQGFTAEFDWVGTRDPTPWLAAPAALELLTELGTDDVYAWNHELAWNAGQLMASAWQTKVPARKEQIGTMVAVPVPDRLGAGSEAAQRLRDRLLFEHRIEVQVHASHGRIWVRVSAQIYNELAEVERLVNVVAAM
jgi:isopenicillin-N epimerase